MNLNDYKVMIINPDDKDHNLTNGNINVLGAIEEDVSHSEAMIDYGLKTYGDSVFTKLSQGYFIPIYPAFFLSEVYGNIVFLNLSGGKGWKKGLLYLPKNLSDEQIDALNSLAPELNGFEIEVNKNLTCDDGIIEGDQNYIICNNPNIIISKKREKKA